MVFTYKEKEMQMAPLHIGNNIQRQDKPKLTQKGICFKYHLGVHWAGRVLGTVYSVVKQLGRRIEKSQT